MSQTQTIKRQYEPIWDQLKVQGKCRIAAPQPLHKRIIKAVVKEKYNDVGYKFLLSETGKTARLSYSRKNSEITFKLTVTVGVDDI